MSSSARVLFTPVADTGALNKWFWEHERRTLDAARKRWGFDFEQGRPVYDDPRWEWHCVDEGTS